MTNYVKSISVSGMHGHQYINLNFGPNLNIVHGRNGTGKTTLLHILANLLEGDIARFCFITFERIVVGMSQGYEIILEQKRQENTRSVFLYIDGIEHGMASSTDMIIDKVERMESHFSIRDALGSRSVYVPAFRSILEAVTSDRNYPASNDQHNEEYQQILRSERAHYNEERNFFPHIGFYPSSRYEATAKKTMMCRDWFGRFVPIIRYPSLSDVERELAEEVAYANFQLSRIDQNTLTSVLKEVLEVVLRQPIMEAHEGIQTSPEELISRINKVDPESFRVPELYTAIEQLLRQKQPSDTSAQVIYRGVLNVYATAISEREQSIEEAFSQVNTFQGSVNSFLDGKYLSVSIKEQTGRRRMSPVRVVLDTNQESGTGILSSGERHVMTLLFSATHMSRADGTLLIDEPELSLHIDWQRKILKELMKQAGNRQIIVCTHAPEVAIDHQDSLVILVAEPWKSQLDLDLDDVLDGEE